MAVQIEREVQFLLKMIRRDYTPVVKHLKMDLRLPQRRGSRDKTGKLGTTLVKLDSRLSISTLIGPSGWFLNLIAPTLFSTHALP